MGKTKINKRLLNLAQNQKKSVNQLYSSEQNNQQHYPLIDYQQCTSENDPTTESSYQTSVVCTSARKIGYFKNLNQTLASNTELKENDELVFANLNCIQSLFDSTVCKNCLKSDLSLQKICKKR